MNSNVRFWGTRVADWDNAGLTRAARTFVRGSGRASRVPVCGPRPPKPALALWCARFSFLLDQTVHLLWNTISQRGVWTTSVIQTHGLIHRQPSAFLGLKFLVQGIFTFQNAVHPLGHRIFRAVIALCHADAQASIGQPVHILMAAILSVLIRMMDGLNSFGQFG